jgi:amidohydrolase
MAIAPAVASVRIDTVAEIRHDLHAHPELGYQETRTCAVVQAKLRELGIEFASGLAGGTGVLGWLPARGHDPDSVPTVALRADMDALPIQEATGKPYASTTPGVMHACGHDGHTSMLIGVAEALSHAENRPNNVLLVFQPAEEGGAGGKRMVEDGALSGKVIGRPVDMIFGQHGWTTLGLGKVATRVGPMMAATNTFTITVHGQGGHAAAPHLGIDPIVVGAHIVTALQGIASRSVDPFDSIVVTIGQVEAGVAVNVIPHTATLKGTVRTMTPETRKLAEERVKSVAQGVAQAFGARAEVEWIEGYPVTSNAPEAVARFMECAKRALGAENVSDQGLPTMGGEDFSFYGAACPACFYQLGLIPHGQGSYPSVHTPEFDFNDDALAVGIAVFCELALAPLNGRPSA